MSNRTTDKVKSHAHFESVVLHKLQGQWQLLASKFGWQGRMVPPVLKLHEGQIKLGTWRTATRTISLSRHLVFERSWAETLEVFKHEMAHQFCDEVLHSDDLPHGKTFQSVCHQHDIDAAPKGIPGVTHVDDTNHIVEKIRRLLDLAAGQANENESQRAAEAAQALMLKYNIELNARGTEQDFVVRHLGHPVGRIQSFQSTLASLLRDHYNVENIWCMTFNPRTGKTGYELEIMGTRDNVDVAEYVYEFLVREAKMAWQRVKKSEEFSDARGKDEDYEDDDLFEEGYKSSRGYTLSARASFLSGFIRGFKSTLVKARQTQAERGLVLVRDPKLEDFFKKRYPSTRSFGGSSGRGNIAWDIEGRNQGAQLNLPKATQGATETKLLS